MSFFWGVTFGIVAAGGALYAGWKWGLPWLSKYLGRKVG